MIYIIAILTLLFAKASFETDYLDHQIKYSLFPNWKWYTENRWKTNSWWLKNVFSIFLDGGHFNRAVYRSITFFFASYIIFDGYWIAVSTVTLYVVTGALHSLHNKTL